ncbi:hypothetical protein DXT99_20185 [Pontibacter diazotrophicus]|uniref:Erythromycin esterase family protein n=1 Tax=Pontibacter diazotrophicus TaxID=1400979 RepID=A0A3D8L7F2_9BACT|nr:erythromycin esterase family protein [Pontibacter diazotrophicus]RDV13340.1 hypothetical protein DXT99_20185 [Pontibacter diazotrophicus]
MGSKLISYCNLRVFLILLGMITKDVLAQETDVKVAWLRQNAIPISLASFPDSQAIAYFDKVLADKQVILLGEQNHGDGTTFQLYSNVVKLLHSRYGFEAVVFESGFYDCRRAWKSISNNEDPLAAFNNSLFKVWAQSEQVQPLFDYIAQQANTSHPLEVSGFDCQFTGYYGRKLFLHEVDSLVQVLSPAYRASDEYRGFRIIAGWVTDYSYPPPYPSVKERELFVQATEHITDLLSALQPEEGLFWQQAIRNLIVQAKVTWSVQRLDKGEMTGREFNNIRDEQMADNVSWLLEGPYKGKKVILWANCSHTIKNTFTLVPKSGRDIFKGANTMGDILFERYGERLYVIGTLSFQGQTGFAHYPQKTNVAPAPVGTWNYLFHLANQKAAFLDLNSQEVQNSWISKPMNARLDASIIFEADWTKVLDGVFFIHDMEPSRKAESSRGIEK